MTTPLVRSLSLANILLAQLQVGGQAVIEGVMMRSPGAMAIAVRRGDGSIVVEERRWRSLMERWPLLKRPFLRGAVILVESMVNGIQALNFSAAQAMEEEETELSNSALLLTMAVAFVFAVALFVLLPHVLSGMLLSAFGDEAGVKSVWFHVADGGIKLALFLAYVVAIGFMPDIRRLFQYHGAEHKSIHAYESGGPLEPRRAALFSRIHPRCGTSFIMAVIAISILIFAVVLPFIPWSGPVLLRIPAQIGVKLLLMFPIAGLSYEFIRYSGGSHGLWVKLLGWPGLLIQRITTQEPGLDQIEVAIAALKGAISSEGEQC